MLLYAKSYRIVLQEIAQRKTKEFFLYFDV